MKVNTISLWLLLATQAWGQSVKIRIPVLDASTLLTRLAGSQSNPENNNSQRPQTSNQLENEYNDYLNNYYNNYWANVYENSDSYNPYAYEYYGPYGLYDLYGPYDPNQFQSNAAPETTSTTDAPPKTSTAIPTSTKIPTTSPAIPSSSSTGTSSTSTALPTSTEAPTTLSTEKPICTVFPQLPVCQTTTEDSNTPNAISTSNTDAATSSSTMGLNTSTAIPSSTTTENLEAKDAHFGETPLKNHEFSELTDSDMVKPDQQLLITSKPQSVTSFCFYYPRLCSKPEEAEFVRLTDKNGKPLQLMSSVKERSHNHNHYQPALWRATSRVIRHHNN